MQLLHLFIKLIRCKLLFKLLYIKMNLLILLCTNTPFFFFFFFFFFIDEIIMVFFLFLLLFFYIYLYLQPTNKNAFFYIVVNRC